MTERYEPCPICSQPVQYWERYPGLLCHECSKRTTDKNGTRVSHYNVSLSGGCYGVYEQEKEPYMDPYCYVDGVKCIADEHRFGGIVVQIASAVKDDPWTKPGENSFQE